MANTYNAPTEAAKRALAAGLRYLVPEIALSAKGYVGTIEDNLVPAVTRDMFETDLSQGDGNELESKFLAAHSSSALAVNCFAPFKDKLPDLEIAGQRGFRSLHFEAKCPTGLRGGRSPNLDVLNESPELVVAIESKCTEYLQPKTWSAGKPPFKPAYSEQIRDERRSGRWFSVMEQYAQDPDAFRHLDVAQLVKHAFGLARVFKGRRVVLFYLFWEPTNASELAVFRRHRDEISRFSELIDGAFPEFQAQGYEELWSDWMRGGCPAWLAAHVPNLRTRYTVAL